MYFIRLIDVPKIAITFADVLQFGSFTFVDWFR